MLSLGLREGALPQLGFNTKDGRQLAFPHTSAPTEAALSRFAAAFLGERLHGLARRRSQSVLLQSTLQAGTLHAYSSMANLQLE